jgi:hypothetical protein
MPSPDTSKGTEKLEEDRTRTEKGEMTINKGGMKRKRGLMEVGIEENRG